MSHLQRRYSIPATATPLIKAGVAIDALAAAAGVAAIGLSVFALVRSRGHRGPYIALFLACLLFTVYHTFAAAFFNFLFLGVLPFNSFIALAIVGNLFSSYSDILLLIASFAILYNRADKRRQSNPQVSPGIVTFRKVLDMLGFVILFLVVTIIVLIARIAEDLEFFGSITPVQEKQLVNAADNIIDVYLVFFLIMSVNLLGSAIHLRMKISAVGTSDKPTNIVQSVIAPLFIVHTLIALALNIASGAHERTPTILRTVQAHARFASTLESAVLITAIIFVLAWLGFVPGNWTTFGDAEGTKPFSAPVYAQQPYYAQQAGAYPPPQPGMYPQYGQQWPQAGQNVAFAPNGAGQPPTMPEKN